MRELVIQDLLTVFPHSSTLPNFFEDSCRLYGAKTRISLIDGESRVLAVPRIVVMTHPEENYKYIILHGQHRSALAALCQIGLDAVLMESEDDASQLPDEVMDRGPWPTSYKTPFFQRLYREAPEQARDVQTNERLTFLIMANQSIDYARLGVELKSLKRR